MTRPDTFTFRINQAERGLLERLSQRLQRTQSDALRWLIREAIRELDAAEAMSGSPALVDEARHE